MPGAVDPRVVVVQLVLDTFMKNEAMTELIVDLVHKAHVRNNPTSKRKVGSPRVNPRPTKMMMMRERSRHTFVPKEEEEEEKEEKNRSSKMFKENERRLFEQPPLFPCVGGGDFLCE